MFKHLTVMYCIFINFSMNPPHLYTNNVKSNENNYSRPNVIRVAQIQVQRWVIILSFIQLHVV